MKPDLVEDSMDPPAPEPPPLTTGSLAMRLAPSPVPAAAGGRGGREELLEHAHPVALHLLVQRAPVLVWTTDPDLRVTWGLKHQRLARAAERLGQALQARDPQSPVTAAHLRALAGEPAEFEHSDEDGALEARVEPLRGTGGAVEGTVGVAVAQSEQDRPERAELVRAGRYDALTQLPSRTLFVERLRRATAGADWCLEGLFVLLLDLDRLRDVNDRFGFEAGDRLLAAAAARLQGRLRPADTLARCGADEFAVLLGGIRDARDAVRVAERLQRELQAPFGVRGSEIRINATVGLAAGLVGQPPENLMRQAESALARAKAFGRGGGPVFPPARDVRETLLGSVETALRRALDNDELYTLYRPTVLRKEGKVAGFEILLWKRRTEAELAAAEARKPSRAAPLEVKAAPPPEEARGGVDEPECTGPGGRQDFMGSRR